MRRFGLVLGLGIIFCVSSLFMLSPGLLQAGSQEKAASANPVPNPSFEDVKEDNPIEWTRETWQPKAEFGLDEAAHTGRKCVRISSKEGADASWAAVVPVRPFARYRLSGWIKTKNMDPGRGRGALFNLHGMDIATKPVRGTRDWTRLSVDFDSGANDAVSVNCLFGGWGKSTGTAWYDDVQIDLLSVRALKPEATIDVSLTSAPVSPLIYGQFIEHLGRCIYQGIWAEMLEDRKFFYAVGSQDSPWKAVGDAANVRMNPIL
ncbi:MAG: hypothetical protein MUQ00_09460, partial [Candidatus Aminicenantes bacterium]|nr:hypothetical protein [Candidatus Aminicenantes bacterium]